MQALGGPPEMKLGGHRHERFQLAQFHGPTVPRVIGTIVARCPAGTGLFGRAEECLSELPLFPRPEPCDPNHRGGCPASLGG